MLSEVEASLIFKEDHMVDTMRDSSTPLRSAQNDKGAMIAHFAVGNCTWAERERQRTGNPKLFEWCVWLADRIADRRERLGHRPASERYGQWRE